MKRQEFEGSIKRPYFHVKALDAAQLATWWAYLDYIQKSGDAGSIVRLYERCLVACASYPGASLALERSATVSMSLHMISGMWCVCER